MDERGRGGYHRQLDPMEGEIGVYHISLPACASRCSHGSHHVCLIATDSSWCTYLTNNLTAKQARTTGSALHSCNALPSKVKQ